MEPITLTRDEMIRLENRGHVYLFQAPDGRLHWDCVKSWEGDQMVASLSDACDEEGDYPETFTFAQTIGEGYARE